MDISIEGEENLPDKHDGKLYTFVSNHPLGGQDGVCLGAIIGRRYDGKFRYLVNDLLMFLPGLRPVCIGINKTGRQARDFPRMVEMGFQSDNHILMFPAGLNSRLIGGRIHDLPWKKTFVTKSVQYQRCLLYTSFCRHWLWRCRTSTKKWVVSATRIRCSSMVGQCCSN